MSTNLGSLLVALPVKDNEIRLPLGHVAANAVASSLMTHLRKRILSRLVTAQTTLRESCQIVLLRVDIMASEAGHRR